MKETAFSARTWDDWRRARLSPTWVVNRAAIAAAVIAMALTSQASVTVGLKPAGETAEQQFQHARMEAERSQAEKLRVGGLRYEEKLALRRSVLQGMKGELAKRRDVVPLYAAAASVRLEEPLSSTRGSMIEWGLAALGLAGMAVHAIWHRRKPARKNVGR